MIRQLPNFFTEPQMVALATLPDRSTVEGVRDRAILGTLCATGVRASELCQLLVRDVTPTLVFVRRGKGGTQRYVPLSSRCRAAIARYLTAHPARPDEPLFRRLEGGALDRRLLYKIVSAYCKRLRLKPGVHILRASCATRLLNRGLNLQLVRALLGHAELASTAIYLGVATDQLVREYRQAAEWAVDGGRSR